MLRRSDGSWAKDEKRLQCRKGDQKSNQHVLDRPAALSVLLQAADVLEGQRLTTDGVQTIAPDEWQFVSYRSSDDEAVTHITAPCAFLCVCRFGHSLQASDPTRLCVRKVTSDREWAPSVAGKD
jgi:hypothetical protein